MIEGPDDGKGLTFEQLPPEIRRWIEPLESNRDHPVRGLFESLGNGFFEDDAVVRGLAIPGAVYRFRHANRVAYLWKDGNRWVVRPWQRLRGRVSNNVEQADDFRAALDLLGRRLSWWQRLWAGRLAR